VTALPISTALADLDARITGGPWERFESSDGFSYGVRSAASGHATVSLCTYETDANHVADLGELVELRNLFPLLIAVVAGAEKVRCAQCAAISARLFGAPPDVIADVRAEIRRAVGDLELALAALETQLAPRGAKNEGSTP
jgi:LSD1 subclass zinc finger protein